MLGEYAYGFYFKQSTFFYAKDRYERYIKDFIYPSISADFDTEKLFVIMNRVYGLQYDDSVHDKIILRYLMSALLSTKRIKTDEEEYVYLQHGDAKRANIIWTEYDSFTFIDIDNIGYRVPMFDFFHYCASIKYCLSDVIAAIQDNIEIFIELCQLEGIDHGEINEAMYYFFSKYVLAYVKMGCYYGDLNWLTDADTSAFKKTNSILASIV